jgi:hypothetical protein
MLLKKSAFCQAAQKAPDARRPGATQMGLFEAPNGKPLGASKP